MDEQTLIKFQKYLAKENGDYLLKDELKGVIKLFTSLLKEIKIHAENVSNSTQDRVYKALTLVEKEVDVLKDDLNENKDISDQRYVNFYKDIKSQIEDLRASIPTVTDFNPIEEKIATSIRELEARIPQLPEELKAEAIRDKLESLEGEDRLDKSAIKGLDEELQRIESIRTSSQPVGVSDMRIARAFKHIAHTEEPVGDIDGVNTTYTVSKEIWWIAGFTINGEQIAELPNFTYSGKTITFSSALPAAYSGKDWEVKYIG